MKKTQKLTGAQVAEMRRRRPAARASLACEGLFLSDDEEAFLEQLDRESLTLDERADRILQYARMKRSERALVKV